MSETDFESDEERHGFNRVVSPVYIIAHEEVVCIGGIAAYTKELLEIVELAVDIAAYGHGTPYGLHI